MYFQELKLKYYQLMIELDEHEGSYLAICKHYKAVYETPEVRENADKMKEVLYITPIYFSDFMGARIAQSVARLASD